MCLDDETNNSWVRKLNLFVSYGYVIAFLVIYTENMTILSTYFRCLAICSKETNSYENVRNHLQNEYSKLGSMT